MKTFKKFRKPTVFIFGALCLLFLVLLVIEYSSLLPRRPLSLRDHTTKHVLLWTPFFSDPDWKYYFKQLPIILTFADGRNCRIMKPNQMQVEEADSVIFHGPDIDFKNIPRKHRSTLQHWVYFGMESPLNLHLGERMNLAALNGIGFNWTMSYSRNSDIWFPYGKFQPLSTKSLSEISAKVQGFKRNFSSRKHDAIWIVSNCRSDSFRERVTKKLQNLGMKIHILGGCGGREFNESVATVDYSQFRFYFAFENSLCDQYVTEKVFQAYDAAIQSGVIPVLFGASSETYAQLLPANSYIDVQSFENVPDLGTFLQQLAANNETYYRALLDKFYEWHLTTELQDYHRNFTSKHYISQFGFQALCQKLWMSDNLSMVTNVSLHYGSCREKKPHEKTFFNLTTLEMLQMHLPFVTDVLAFLKDETGQSSIQHVAERLDNQEDQDETIRMMRRLLGIS